jgi:hypothetical protein
LKKPRASSAAKFLVPSFFDANYTSRGILDRRYRDRDIEVSAIFGETNRFKMVEAFASTDPGEDFMFLFLAIQESVA